MARVFISYSRRDEAWMDKVVRQLGVLADEGLETWDDRRTPLQRGRWIWRGGWG